MMQSFHITSIKDARVVEARELTSVAGRARFQKTQLEGEESVQWALEAHLIVEHVFYSANLRPRAFLETLQARGIACYAVSDGILKKISDTSYLVPVHPRHVPNRDLHRVESQRNCHMTILSLLGLDLEQQFASVGIAFHTLMRESCLPQWQRLGDSNVDLACHEEINDPPRGRDKIPGIVLSEVAETVA